LQVDLEAVGAGVAVVGKGRDLRVDGQPGEGGFTGGPKLVEVGRLFLRRLDGFGLEGGGGESAIRAAVLLDGRDAAEKARFVHRPSVDGEAVGGEGRGLLDRGRHHLGADAVVHLDAGERVAVAGGDDAEADGLAGFVAPVGPVGGDADLDRADAVLGSHGKGEKGDEDKSSKHTEAPRNDTAGGAWWGGQLAASPEPSSTIGFSLRNDLEKDEDICRSACRNTARPD
jgi:hypothetical protein